MEKKLKKGKKVTVLGAGNVGASIAFALAIKGLCSELLLIDINKPKAKGEAMDIMQGNAFCPSCDIHDGDYHRWYCQKAGSDPYRSVQDQCKDHGFRNAGDREVCSPRMLSRSQQSG